MSALSLLLLYCLFRLKQFVCDFALQTNWAWVVENKGKSGIAGWVPTLSHAAVHGVGTLILFLIFLPSFWWMGLVDVIVHALIDRTKAVLTERQGWTMRDAAFWNAFALDQEAHNFTHLAYIVLIVVMRGGITF
ncbi:MAG: DUF3307 domain-containing protein [Pseudobdellovibrionaceae bacterium]